MRLQRTDKDTMTKWVYHLADRQSVDIVSLTGGRLTFVEHGAESRGQTLGLFQELYVSDGIVLGAIASDGQCWLRVWDPGEDEVSP